MEGNVGQLPGSAHWISASGDAVLPSIRARELCEDVPKSKPTTSLPQVTHYIDVLPWFEFATFSSVAIHCQHLGSPMRSCASPYERMGLLLVDDRGIRAHVSL